MFFHPLGSREADTTSTGCPKTFAKALATLPLGDGLGRPAEGFGRGDPLRGELIDALAIAFAARQDQPLRLPEHLSAGDDVLCSVWPVAYLLPLGIYPEGWDESEIYYGKGFPNHLLHRWLTYVQANPLAPDTSLPAPNTDRYYRSYFNPRH